MPDTDLRFFFDFVSPYTYLASTQVDGLVARTGARVRWMPAFLGAIMKATGNVPPATLPARAVYMGRDLARWASQYGVPFSFSPHFPFPSHHALRSALAIQELAPDRFRPFVDACFKAVWADGRNLGERAVIAELAAEVGAPAGVDDATDDPRWKAALLKNTEEAIQAGAFGLPAFVFGEKELYFGNDRLPLVETRIHRGEPWAIDRPPVVLG